MPDDTNYTDEDGDPDEFVIPDEHECYTCGIRWVNHQEGENGVTSIAGDCTTFIFVPPGWEGG